jgi:hypothetical protein
MDSRLRGNDGEGFAVAGEAFGLQGPLEAECAPRIVAMHLQINIK